MTLKDCCDTLSVVLRDSAQDKAPASFWSLQGALYPLLRAGSVLYRFGYEVRMWLYRKGIYKTQSLLAPVISVGNLTWGGNGKTPMAEYVTRRMLSAGLRPALLVRGHKNSDEAWMLHQRLRDTSTVLGFGRDRTASARWILTWHGVAPSDGIRKAALTLAIDREEEWEVVESDGVNGPDGDESVTRGSLYGSHGDVNRPDGGVNGPDGDANVQRGSENGSHGVNGSDGGLDGPDCGINGHRDGANGPDAGVKRPVWEDPVGVVILDDGMQHLALDRDIEIVMVNAVSYFGNGRLIPSGPLREPRAALRRADAVVLHHSDLVSEDWRRHVTSDLRRYLRAETPVLPSKFVASRLVCDAGPNLGRRESLEAVRGVAVVAVSGIGCPRSLELLLLKLGAARVESRAFGDHHVFSVEDLTSALPLLRGLEDSRQYSRCMLVTTEKDFDRCGRTFRDAFHDVDCYTLIGSLEMDAASSEKLDGLLSKALLKRTHKPTEQSNSRGSSFVAAAWAVRLW